MSLQSFSRSIRINRPAHEVFAWHARTGALQRLTPPWEQVELVRHEGIGDGARAELRSKAGPFWTRWVVEHRDCIEDKQFCDVQIEGPFSVWRHAHRIEAEGASACTLTDEIAYRLPGGFLGQAVAGGWTRRKLERLFAYRHAVTKADVELKFRYGTVRSLRFLIAGASGLVGGALTPFLQSQGHEVLRLVRGRAARPDEISWDPERGELDAARLRGVDVIINLAGENVAGGRWTPARREAILSSRVNAWENETAEAEALGLRAVALRTGVVLTAAGGALGKMLPAFRAGLGGRMGSGRQWMSWITMDDLVGAIYHTVLDQRCAGPVNTVAPEPVRNAEFARVLGAVLKRPALLPAPAPLLKLALGSMAEDVLLAGVRVAPSRLQEAGFVFRFTKLEPALRHVLGR